MVPLIGAILIFVVAALLYYQSGSIKTEGFRNHSPMQPPVAVDETSWSVPADLNRAPIAKPSVSVIPQSTQRPTAIPGAPTAPREAIAERKDLYELDNKISTWLFAATQRESDHPGSLTPEQLQRRIILQTRIPNIRHQLVNDKITDTYKQVAAETMELRRENAGWGSLTPSLDAIHQFAAHSREDAFLTEEQYKEFRTLFDKALNELKGQTQPNPLERVRLQQLELIQQDLLAAEKKFNPPPIRVGAARRFLQQSLRVDQPLPTLFALEPHPDQMPALHSANPADVIGQLRDIQWRLTVSYNPAEQELNREVAALLRQLQSDTATPTMVAAARSATADLTHRLAPKSATGSPAHPLAWDPDNLQKRAKRLCHQIHEAFPHDAEALGCPPKKTPITTDYEAESTINIVCDRLHYSVPSVSPAQFGCGKHV